MGLNLEYLPGQTPLDEEEKDGLKIKTIVTKGELDEFEQKNIEQAIQWTIGRKYKIDKIISESFVKSLHKRMYSEVWIWAGNFRSTNKNIGVDRWQIPTELRKLLDDTLFWIEHTSFSEDEIAIRFKHRIVSIHCFPNGNGRHSRLMGDLIAEKIFKRKIFTWGQLNVSKTNDIRTEYLNALKKADKGDYTDLIHFARS
ncbi:mobile mystery protein B [Cytophaga aurantiaca]|uniref:mobile mystery protein B n=1 Tax=Cytophaga aurantiaca TaxID=29530 RepID=UPI000365F0FF|nr:mobile mystery protein B [Cytophaga aurantiaca]